MLQRIHRTSFDKAGEWSCADVSPRSLAYMGMVGPSATRPRPSHHQRPRRLVRHHLRQASLPHLDAPRLSRQHPRPHHRHQEEWPEKQGSGLRSCGDAYRLWSRPGKTRLSVWVVGWSAKLHSTGVQSSISIELRDNGSIRRDDPGVCLFKDAHEILVAQLRHAHERSGDLSTLKNTIHQ